MKKTKNPNEIIYRATPWTTSKDLFDKVRTREVNAYGKLYLVEVRTMGAYDDNGEDVTPYGGRVTVTTGADNIGNLEKLYKELEEETGAELYLDKAAELVEMTATTFKDDEELEKIESILFYAFVYRLN